MNGRLPSSAAARLGRPAINQNSRSIEEILLQRTAAAAMASLDAQAQARGRPAGQKTQLLQLSQLSQLTQMTDLAQSLQRATSAPGLRVATPQRPFSAAAALSRNQLADSLRAGDALDVRAPAQRPATSTARRTMAAAHSATPEHRARPQQAGHPPAGPASSTDGRWPQPAARESSQAALLPRSALRRSLTAGRYVDPASGGAVPGENFVECLARMAGVLKSVQGALAALPSKHGPKPVALLYGHSMAGAALSILTGNGKTVDGESFLGFDGKYIMPNATPVQLL